jgi:AraC-like DNA-binding protein
MNNAPAQTVRAAFRGGQGGLQTGGSGDRRHHPIGRALRRFDHCGSTGASLDAGAGELGLELRVEGLIGDSGKTSAELARQFRQCGGIAMSGDRLDPIELGVLAQQVDRARADRACRPKQCYGARRGLRDRRQIDARRSRSGRPWSRLLH